MVTRNGVGGLKVWWLLYARLLYTGKLRGDEFVQICLKSYRFIYRLTVPLSGFNYPVFLADYLPSVTAYPPSGAYVMAPASYLNEQGKAAAQTAPSQLLPLEPDRAELVSFSRINMPSF